MNWNEKMMILQDFDRIHKDGTGKNCPDCYTRERAFYEEFLDHPERFRPTVQALLNVYERAFEGRGEWLEIAQKTRVQSAKQKVESCDLKDVFVTAHWGYSSTMGNNCQIIQVYANAKRDNGEYEEVVDDRIAFSISDYVERIPTAEPTQP